jgi:hypothetical protein
MWMIVSCGLVDMVMWLTDVVGGFVDWSVTWGVNGIGSILVGVVTLSGVAESVVGVVRVGVGGGLCVAGVVCRR